MEKMKEDFEYNLRILADKDAALEEYDKAFERMKEMVISKEKTTKKQQVVICSQRVSLK